MTMEILKVQDLCKTYGKGEAKVEALKKVSFSPFEQRRICQLLWVNPVLAKAHY